MDKNETRAVYEERRGSGFEKYFQLYFDGERFGIVYQDMNSDWIAHITDGQHDRHFFICRTRAMDYIEEELKVKYRDSENLPWDFKISRPRYKRSTT